MQRFGLVRLSPVVQKVTIPRDDDPPGSTADCALWRGAVRRAAQNLEVVITQRPSERFSGQSPPFKDLDDVYRRDPGFVAILLRGANLVHGRLGKAVEDAIIDEASWLGDIALGHAAKRMAPALGTTAGRF